MQAGRQGIKSAVHGDAGVGKTVLGSTAPKPCYISAENGLLSLRHLNLPVYPVTSIKTWRESWAWVSTSPEARQFETFVIDSVSEVADITLREIKSKTKDGRAAYGEMQDEIATIMRNFRDLSGPNVLMIFQSEQYADESVGTKVRIPSVPGNTLKQDLPYFFDELFYMFAGVGQDQKPYRALRTQPDYRASAKDRSGALAEIEPPDLTYIFNKIKGS